jgi:hypothetical protein
MNYNLVQEFPVLSKILFVLSTRGKLQLQERITVLGTTEKLQLQVGLFSASQEDATTTSLFFSATGRCYSHKPILLSIT